MLCIASPNQQYALCRALRPDHGGQRLPMWMGGVQSWPVHARPVGEGSYQLLSCALPVLTSTALSAGH